MATGDIANNLRKLQKEMKLIKYSDHVDLTGMSQGTPTAFLPIYHYLFTSYSHSIAEMISSSDTELFGKTDFRFIEAVYKIMRDIFTYKPPVTKEQFFNAGFAERKVIMCAEVIQMIREKNKALQPNKKPTTSAVSTISHSLNKKSSRPKTAESNKLAPQSLKHPSRPGTGDQKQVKFAAEEVVNELRQPPKHDTARHVAHKDPPSPVTIVNMSPVVTKEIIKMEEHPSRGFKYAVVTPAVAKLTQRTTRSGDTNATKGLNFDAYGDIEVVNAITPDTSLYEPLHSTGIIHEEVHNQISTLQQSVDDVTQRLSSFETAMTSVTNLMQNHPPTTDPKLLDIVSGIQQQIENLTARMVLIENRVSIVESKVQTSVPPVKNSDKAINGHKEPNSNYLTKQNHNSEFSHGTTSCFRPSELSHGTTSQIHPNELPYGSTSQIRPGEFLQSTTSQIRPGEPSHSTTSQIHAGELLHGPTSQIRPSYNQKSSEIQPYEERVQIGTKFPQSDSSMPRLKETEKQSQNEPGNEYNGKPTEGYYKSPSSNYSDNTSIPSYLANSDQFSFALSPIRTIKDTSGYKPGPNATGEDTFALETEDDARRSSTPTDFKDLPLKTTCDDHDSMSFHCGDMSMQQRVDRIKNMMVSTKTMLNK